MEHHYERYGPVREIRGRVDEHRPAARLESLEAVGAPWRGWGHRKPRLERKAQTPARTMLFDDGLVGGIQLTPVDGSHMR